MWRISNVLRQLQRQPHADALGYSAAFAGATERPVTDYQIATAPYSPGATQLARRKGHLERQRRYTEKIRMISSTARLKLNMCDKG
ncbi:hypothetical protein DPX39_070074900 [Trypanosoma brucei equiperdum]|uniref:Uncharacterized protein n=1 Tax=Trypanosoma brucei equiperdum TaxID=630700 RepID=A0A3L6L4L6_9TRYP|nr:hypothetical protein DPX39_070074900 [Trypanosoma brucei equiperdum]